MTSECARIAEHLGAFVDDRLTGQKRLAVAKHLDTCVACAAEVEDMRRVGASLRAMPDGAGCMDARLSGLAARVVGRVRAEERLSWRCGVARVFDGWRWFIVGAGSLTATVLTATFLTLVLIFGPGRARDDSLSALLGNLASPPGHVFLFVSSVQEAGGMAMLQVENGMPLASRSVTALANLSPAPYRPSEADLVGELASRVTRDGQVISLGAMDRATRARTEALFDEITNLRVGESIRLRRTVNVRAVRLVTSVTAKG